MNLFKQNNSAKRKKGHGSSDQPLNKPRRRFLQLIGIGSSLVASRSFGNDEFSLTDELLLKNAGSIAADTEFFLYRPQDLLFLKFSFFNFEIRNDKKLHRKGNSNAYVIISFQTQSIAETAYPENQTPQLPAQAFAADDSRLVYEIPSGITELPLTAEALLSFSGWKLRVNSRAAAPVLYYNGEVLLPDINSGIGKKINSNPGKRPGGINSLSKASHILKNLPPVTSSKARNAALNHASRVADKNEQLQLAVSRLPQEELNRLERIKNGGSINAFADLFRSNTPGPLDDLETSIEMPWRLFLSPAGIHTFAHDHKLKLFGIQKNAPIQIYELWHSRMALQNFKNTPGETDADKLLLTMRALWGVDVLVAQEGVITPNSLFPIEGSGPTFMEAMSRKDRQEIVHKSSNWAITKYLPRPIQVKRMMLSTLGAWLDSEFTVPREDLEALNLPINLLKWSHKATMARDHFVEVVRAGNILPFGHKAVFVKITERKPALNFALNRKREFVIITEPEKSFMPRGDGNEDRFLSFPFRKITIHTTITPPISSGTEPFVSSLGCSEEKRQCVIKVGGTEFPFRISAVDSEGNEIHFEMPLVFVSTEYTGTKGKSGATPPLPAIISQYKTGNKITKTTQLKNQCFAVADSLVPGDTSFEAEQIKFSCQLIDVKDEFHCFYPGIELVKIVEPASGALTGHPVVSTITLVDDADNTASPNIGKVYAEFTGTENKSVKFDGNSDKTGGSLSPNFTMTGLSKLKGAFGGPMDKMKSLYTSVESLTDLDTDNIFNAGLDSILPKLFGCVDLSKIVKLTPLSGKIEDLLQNANALKNKADEITNKVNGLTANIDSLKSRIAEKQAAISQLKEKGQATLDEIKNLDTLNTDLLNEVKNFDLPIPGLKRIKLPTAESYQYNWFPEAKDFENELKLEGILSMTFTQMPTLPAFSTGNETDPEIIKELKEKRKEEENKNRNIYITTLIKRPNLEQVKGGNIIPEFTAESGVKNITVKLFDIIEIRFKEVLFKVEKDTKVDFNVELGVDTGNEEKDSKEEAIKFLGPLSFIQRIRNIIPGNGFSDPPELDVTKEGIKTGYTLAVPDLSLGCFLLGNLSLAARINLPFTGAPMTMRFNVSEREKPFVLTVSALGGSGFFGMELDLKGLRMLEASLEFGAALSMDIGVASGEVCVMGGIYIKIKMDNGNTATELTGFVRINGSMSVLALITVSVEFYLALEYKNEKASGEATLKVKIELLFFSKTVDLHVKRDFSGSGGDPTFSMLMPKPDWNEYCDGFAA